MDLMTFFVGLCAGVGLAAACGFRVFAPLLVMGVAARLGVLPLGERFDWLSGNAAMVALAAATAVEVAAYYIPWVDNLLDTIATPAAVLAGTAAMVAVLPTDDPFLKWALGLIAGGGAAGAIQLSTVVTRVTSSATTGGLGNVIVSTIEAIAAVILAALAVLLPILAAALVVLTLGALAALLLRRRRSEAP
ncbi:MAG TPA: DUF4126 domain-containing protein [Phycisphaeraceae bacterium]